MIPEGSLGLAAFAAVAFLGGLLLERALTVWRFGPYYRLGIPLPVEPLPIPDLPEGEGQTASVRWAVEGDEVRWWSDPSDRAAPMGLHGMARFKRDGVGYRIFVTWAPPWSPLAAGAWLAGLGLARGMGTVTVPIGAMMIAGVLFLYYQSAVKAAAQLRYGFVNSARD